MGMVLTQCRAGEGCIVKTDHESGLCSSHRRVGGQTEIILRTRVVDAAQEPERVTALLERVIEPAPEVEEAVHEPEPNAEKCWCGGSKEHRGRHRKIEVDPERFNYGRWWKWRRDLIEGNMATKDDEKNLKVGVFILAALRFGVEDAKLLADVTRLTLAEVNGYQANMRSGNAWEGDKWVVDDSWDTSNEHRMIQFALWMLTATGEVTRVPAKAESAKGA